MNINLTYDEKTDLEKDLCKEQYGLVCLCMKAVLLHAESWIGDQIAKALRIHLATIYKHLKAIDTQESNTSWL